MQRHPSCHRLEYSTVRCLQITVWKQIKQESSIIEYFKVVELNDFLQYVTAWDHSRLSRSDQEMFLLEFYLLQCNILELFSLDFSSLQFLPLN